MKSRRIAILTPAALIQSGFWLYLAFRANAVFLAVLAIDPSASVEAKYSSVLANILSMIILLIAWLSLTIMHFEQIFASPTIPAALWRGAKSFGWSLIAFGLLDAVFLAVSGIMTASPLTLLISLIAWIGGTALLIASGQQGKREKEQV